MTAPPRLAIVLVLCLAGSAACGLRRPVTTTDSAALSAEPSALSGVTGADLPAGCAPPARMALAGRSPRCVVFLGRLPAAMAMTPDGGRVIVSIFEGATGMWQLPDGGLAGRFEEQPEESEAHGDHEDEPRVIVASADGTEALFAIGSRIVRYDVASGRPRTHVEGPGGMIDDLAWSGRGTRVLLAAAGDGRAHLFDMADARNLRTFADTGRVVKVALSADDGWAAFGTDVGTIGIVDLRGQGPPRVVTPSTQEVAGMTFAGDRLVVAGRDGMLRVFAAATGKELVHADARAPLVSVAVSPDRRLAATADDRHRIRVFALRTGALIETLEWHRASVGAVAWGIGPTLLVADNDGELALWNVPAAGD